ncbi:SGNH/GDSL hydrolase family protein, partial [Adhaeribacter aquaticus]|uniref:SGNH/GDSL hydrolase family protein n=1 Tax=Adhaeribacter aquaticus TaxID=299567 RepID=UPI00047DDB4E
IEPTLASLQSRVVTLETTGVTATTPNTSDLSTADTKLIFPNKLFVVEGRPFQLYLSSMLPDRNKTVASRVAAFQSINNAKLPYNILFTNTLEVNPDRLGSTATLTLRNAGLADREMQLALTVHKSPANKTKSINVWYGGDSTVAQSTTPLLEKFASGNITATSIGTRLNGAYYSEGRGGWKGADFVYIQNSNGHAPLPIGSEAQALSLGNDTRNPFIRVATGSDAAEDIKNGYIFDFRFYLNRFSFADPDVVVLNFMTNDINNDGTNIGVANALEAYRIIIASIRSACPNAKIGIAMPMNGNNSYFNPLWYDGYVKTFLKLCELYGNQQNNNIYVIGAHAYLTDQFIYPMNTVSTDSQTGLIEQSLNDGTHPINPIGRHLFAEPLYQFIHAIC